MTSSLNLKNKCPGVLFLVVGPSGVGKDSLIDGAKAVLEGNPQFVFPRRTIVRAADAGSEAHRTITEYDFETEEAAGLFAFSWRAHGLAYGIPKTITDDLTAGRSVIINVSRAILDRARRRFPYLRVISIHAPEEVLAGRLSKRGRESKSDIRKRLDRAHAYDVTGPDVIELVNDGTLEVAVEQFVAILHETTQPQN
jgi:ribose 1,5-bisphosphokinase